MTALKLTEAELDAAIEARHLPHTPEHINDSALPYCTGDCGQGRRDCDCPTGGGMPQMWDVESERPRLSASLCALAIIGTVALCALFAGCAEVLT